MTTIEKPETPQKIEFFETPEDYPDLLSGEERPFIPVHTAIFSTCQQYRYFLSRQISLTGGSILFIGLNPSTADHRYDDPTIRRLRGFTERNGFGSFGIVNLFAYRSADPVLMKGFSDPVGPDNDAEILKAAKSADLIVAMWGNHGRHKKRHVEVMSLIVDLGIPIKCFGHNNNGTPKHPLYLKSNTELKDL